MSGNSVVSRDQRPLPDSMPFLQSLHMDHLGELSLQKASGLKAFFFFLFLFFFFCGRLVYSCNTRNVLEKYKLKLRDMLT